MTHDEIKERAREEAERIVSNAECATQFEFREDDDYRETIILNVEVGLVRFAESLGAQSGEGPRCPKCGSDYLKFNGFNGYVSCQSCCLDVEAVELKDFSQFFRFPASGGFAFGRTSRNSRRTLEEDMRTSENITDWDWWFSKTATEQRVLIKEMRKSLAESAPATPDLKGTSICQVCGWDEPHDESSHRVVSSKPDEILCVCGQPRGLHQKGDFVFLGCVSSGCVRFCPAPAADPPLLREAEEVLDRLNADAGWRGSGENDKDIFYCEFCRQSHEDSNEISHLPACGAGLEVLCPAASGGQPQPDVCPQCAKPIFTPSAKDLAERIAPVEVITHWRPMPEPPAPEAGKEGGK